VRGLGTGATINGQGVTSFYFFRTTWGQNHTFTMENLTITNCVGATGGVIKYDGGSTQGTNHYRANNCRFVGNSATTTGGVLANGADWVIEDCYFAGNSAPIGAVFPATGASLYITNSIFRHNTAKKGVIFGDIQNYPQSSGNIDAYKCDFSCNVATNGGGTFANKIFKNMAIRHCTFTNNVVSSGSSVFDEAASSATSILFEDSVMDHNTSGGEGGVFGVACGSQVVIRRCKVTNNTSLRCSVGGSTGCQQNLRFENCLLEGNVSTTGANWYNCGMFGCNGKHSKLEFDNCVIRNNVNRGGGTGVLIWCYSANTNDTLKIKGSLIEGNYSASSVSLFDGDAFQLEIDDCTFKNNGISPDGVYTNQYLMKLGSCAVSRHVRNSTFTGNWGKGTGWKNYGLIGATFKSTLDDLSQPISFFDIDHCTFVSNHMLKVANSTPTLLYSEATATGLRISNCAFADNFDTAGNDLAVKESTAGVTSMKYCKMTATTTCTDVDHVDQSVASSAFKFQNFGDNGIKTTLYGTEKLPTWSIAKGSCLIDAATGSLATDERGFARDSKPDIGAYEFQLVLSKGLQLFLR